MEVTAKDGKIVPKGEEKPETKKRRGRPPKKKEEPKVVVTEETYSEEEPPEEIPLVTDEKLGPPKQESFLPEDEEVFKNTMDTDSVSYKEESVTAKEVREPKDVKPRESRVSVTIGYTKNLGNYESLKISLSSDEYCEADKKRETWDRLKNEVMERLESYVLQAGAIKAKQEAEKAVSTNISGSEAMRPASVQTKGILNQHMKEQAKNGFDYEYGVALLREAKTLTEIEARQIIQQVSRGDYSYFESEIPQEAEEIPDDF